MIESAVVDLGGRCAGIRFPSDIAHELAFAFGPHFRAHAPESPSGWIVVHQQAMGGYAVLRDRTKLSDVSRRDLVLTIMDAVMTSLIESETSSVALHAGAVEMDGDAILIVGASGDGKSSLVAWLVQNDFAYMTDELAFLSPGGMVAPFNRSLVMKAGSARQVDAMKDLAVSLPAGPNFLVRPAGGPGPVLRRCRCIVFVHFEHGTDFCTVPMAPGAAAAELIRSNLNARSFTDGGMGIIASLTNGARALSLRYGGFDQLDTDFLNRLR